MFIELKHDRRRFLTVATMAAAATRLGMSGTAGARPIETTSAPGPASSEGSGKSFGAIKHINAGELNVAYAETGPADGPRRDPPARLAIRHPQLRRRRSLLAARGYRVIVPHLRGYGPTRFLSIDAVRNGQPAAVASDLVALMDALHIEKAVLAGFDWGARTANIIGALWPERCKAMVSVSGYLIGSQKSGMAPLPPNDEFQWWYQFYFATERGHAGYDKYHREFAKLIWRQASPKWNFDDATFDRSAAAFDNPDHVAIAIHNYRWRLGLADGERKYDDIEKRLAEAPVIGVPTITMEGDANGAPIRSRAPTEGNSRASTSTEMSRGASVTTFLRRHRTRSPWPS